MHLLDVGDFDGGASVLVAEVVERVAAKVVASAKAASCLTASEWKPDRAGLRWCRQ